MCLDVLSVAWHFHPASKHVQQKLSFSISYPPSRSSASRFSLGALFRFLFWKNRTKCLQGTFDLKFFPPDFSGFIFSPPCRPRQPCSARRLRQPCQPVRQPAPVRASRPRASVRQPARASACASLRQSTTPAVRQSASASTRRAPARADSCQPSARARSRPRRLYALAAPYMVDCPPVTY